MLSKLFGKKRSLASLATPFVDSHSHILPGVDDGFKEAESSLKALEILEGRGARHIWCTPHIMEDIPNTPDDLRRRFDDLKNRYQGNARLHLAAEYMLDPHFEAQLAADNLLPMELLCGKSLLVETSYFSSPANFDDLLSEINKRGYFAILAHPERYIYMDRKQYESLRERKVIFQLNYFSLIGKYGETARKKAEWLLDHGFYSLLGSDLHSLRHIDGFFEDKGISDSRFKLLQQLAERSAEVTNCH